MTSSSGRTVRAIFEAKVDQAKKNIVGFGKDVADTGKKVDGLTDDLKSLDSQKVKPDIDLKIDDAKKRLKTLTGDLADLKSMEASPEVDLEIDRVKGQIADVRGEIKELTSQKAEVRLEVAAKDAQKRIKEITQELGDLRTMDASPEVDVNIKDAQKRLRDAKAELRELNGAKATLEVEADTSAVDSAFDGVGDAGAEAGDEAGAGLADGIIGSLKAIPIAGAIVGVGAAIGVALVAGIKDGLSVEAGRDFFSAQTGLDAATSARFARAAGEAYAQTWGESVEANLDTASLALRAGIIDSDATDREIENVIAKLSGIQELFDYDVTESVRGVGNLMKTGLVKDANEAFDLIVAGSQKVASDDLIDTMTEYSSLFGPLGLDAQDAFGLIVQGAEAGARDTDKVADAMKELGNFAREGLEPAREAMQKLGLDADDTVAAFQEGGPRARAAIGDVLDGLRDLDEQGGNTQEIVATLFGGPGEDLGAALFALDIDSVNEALGGTEGAAGAADRALQTMTDNAAAEVEKARRNIEVGMDGIKGALAAAFSDDISAAAEWVSKNREPLMRFFLDVVNGALEAGIGFAEFGASLLDTIASVADGIAGMPFIGQEMRDAMGEVSESARTGADNLRGTIPGALEDVQDRINEWAAPELLKARIHDATVAMAEDMDAFSTKVDQSGGTIKINGETVNAEQALEVVLANIDEEEGTVTINGTTVPAEDALVLLMDEIDLSEGDVEIGGQDSEARAKLQSLIGAVNAADGTMSVYADTASAEAELDRLTRDRYVTLGVRVSGAGSAGGLLSGMGAHTGRRLTGLNGGGRVPGMTASYDNVLWPLNSGGQTLQQPLTGGEWVLNPDASAMWNPLLRAMNAGLKPSDLGGGGSSYFTANVQVHGVTVEDAVREAEALQRRSNLSGRKT